MFLTGIADIRLALLQGVVRRVHAADPRGGDRGPDDPRGAFEHRGCRRVSQVDTASDVISVVHELRLAV